MAKLIAKLEDGRDVYGTELQDVEVKAGDNDSVIEMIGSTEAIDRDGEVLSMDGWDLKNFKKNPVVLEGHNYGEPAIGRAKVSIKDRKMVFKIEFPPEGVHPRADLFKKLYKLGFMKASSVGFIPKDWVMGDGDKTPRRTFTKQELLEISLVTVPSNPEALLNEKGIKDAREKGQFSDVNFEQLTKWVKEITENKGVAPDPLPTKLVAVAEPFEKNVLTETEKPCENELSEKTLMDFKKLLEEHKEEMKSLVKEAIGTLISEKSSDDLKEIVKVAIKEINEEVKADAMVLGDAGESHTQTDKELDIVSLTRETASEVLKSKPQG